MTEKVEQISTGKVYEASFLLVPTIAEEAIPEVFGRLKKGIEKNKVSFISEELPKMMTLSYQMSKTIGTKKEKFDRGYFGWIKFECEKDAVALVKRGIEELPETLRLIIVKTIRENIAPHRPTLKVVETRQVVHRPVTEAEKAPIATPASIAEIDKSIEELIV